ncbi:MAG: IS66 family transposase [Acidimicrobiales bacterium]
MGGDRGDSAADEKLVCENARLSALVAFQAATIERLEARVTELGASQPEMIVRQAEMIGRQAEAIERQAQAIKALEAQLADLQRRTGQNSGNSGKPPSRDSAKERQRQAEERRRRTEKQGEPKRKPGKQRGAPGSGLQMSPDPDDIVNYRPDRCEDCGAALDPSAGRGYQARQVVELPEVKPKVTEHRAHTYGCGCGHETTAAFPGEVRAPVSYGPRVRAVVAYLLGRQHIPNRRVAEAMEDLFGLPISTGAVDSVYAEAGRRLGGFVTALVALLASLPVLHADETTDRVGTRNCWMHVVSTGLYTLIHASMTRSFEAIEEAGVLAGYRGVVVHDRLALYWKLKAKHGVCCAHLLRDLADVAVVATQTAWASGLAALLVEINAACEEARLRGLRQLGPSLQRGFAARYDALVAQGFAANPEPAHRKRDSVQKRSFNLVTAFSTHRRSILRYMYDLDVGFTNNQAERDLRPSKLHRKISGCFRSKAGAERFAHLRSYLSTTRKNGVSAIDALIRLFEGNPWMPPEPS